MIGLIGLIILAVMIMKTIAPLLEAEPTNSFEEALSVVAAIIMLMIPVCLVILIVQSIIEWLS